ncbi:hypothetical protein [Streptomyces griseorubiginosus]|uniref:hypothetical protein n=1 Tax=Streptomyces griseorubiginosus TaxID=67304 RepID=UPI00076C742B|nr:hypothetical protein [Streptomyces griseorubiginosus]KUM69251.1 hypothetical protein AQI84_34560 [Streptomyces griseorubiginosus]
MSRVYETRTERPLHQQPLASRVMTYLRHRQEAGLDPWADLDTIQHGTKIADRSDVTSVLAFLTERARVERDPGPCGLAEAGRPTRWKIAA